MNGVKGYRCGDKMRDLVKDNSALILCLSVHTVTTHRRNISQKLQIHSTAGLIIYAIANKLVDIAEIQ